MGRRPTAWVEGQGINVLRYREDGFSWSGPGGQYCLRRSVTVLTHRRAEAMRVTHEET